MKTENKMAQGDPEQRGSPLELTILNTVTTGSLMLGLMVRTYTYIAIYTFLHSLSVNN